MKAQIIDNKIVAIGENIVKTSNNNVYEIDVETLPLTEDGYIDYEKIFNSQVKIKSGKIIKLIDEEIKPTS